MSNKSQLDKIRKDFQSHSNFGKYIKVEPDSTLKIRILPPWKDDGFFYYRLGTHFGFNIGGSPRGLSCPESVGKGICPVEPFLARLKDSDSKAHDKLFNKIRCNRYFYMNVLNRTDGKVYIYRGSKKLVDKILSFHDKTGVDVTDPIKGRDLLITRTGKGFTDTRYKFKFDKTASKAIVKASDLIDLESVVPTWYSPRQMHEYLVSNYGEEMHEVGMSRKFKGEEEQEDEIKTVRKKSNKKKQHIIQEDDDDDEDDIDMENLELEDDE